MMQTGKWSRAAISKLVFIIWRETDSTELLEFLNFLTHEFVFVFKSLLWICETKVHRIRRSISHYDISLFWLIKAEFNNSVCWTKPRWIFSLSGFCCVVCWTKRRKHSRSHVFQYGAFPNNMPDASSQQFHVRWLIVIFQKRTREEQKNVNKKFRTKKVKFDDDESFVPLRLAIFSQGPTTMKVDLWKFDGDRQGQRKDLLIKFIT